jgi:hypothetical protein
MGGVASKATATPDNPTLSVDVADPTEMFGSDSFQSWVDIVYPALKTDDGRYKLFFDAEMKLPLYFVARHTTKPSERISPLEHIRKLGRSDLLLECVKESTTPSDSFSTWVLRIECVHDVLMLLGAFAVQYLDAGSSEPESSKDSRMIVAQVTKGIGTFVLLPNWPQGSVSGGTDGLDIRMETHARSGFPDVSTLSLVPAVLDEERRQVLKGWRRKAVETQGEKLKSVMAAGASVVTGASLALGGLSGVKRRAAGFLSKDLEIFNALFESFALLHRALLLDVQRIRQTPARPGLYTDTLKDLREGLKANHIIFQRIGETMNK